ncbi:cell division protein [Streptococcus downei MFe28]|uniref:Cell division protein n=1 Tax=Streptococcus downei MFe28 TaxID=764290 RepID=A0A380KQ72_STRDO|nr:cell division protein [Streptococcus downei MFe28]
MAKSKSTKASKKSNKQKAQNKRPTKKEREHKKAVRKMMVAFLMAFILFFAIIRLGVFGITAYNLVRVVVGSLAYPAIFGSSFYLFAGKWLQKHTGFMSGYISHGWSHADFHAYLIPWTL